MRLFWVAVYFTFVSTLFGAGVSTADDVQEQIRLMEQRMTEMEERLQTASDELRTARATVDEQQMKLSDAGLLAGDSGLRSGAASFFEQVDISGVAAASYNQRLIESETFGNLATPSSATGAIGNGGYTKNANSNTFQVDQIWLTMDKAPTAESRAGFHAEFVTGESNWPLTVTNDSTPHLFSGYVSYLAPVGQGVRIDLGRLVTVLGPESVQTNLNDFITQGALFSQQPGTYTGVQLSTNLTDEIGLTAGIVNDVYDDTMVSTDNDKAYFAQLTYTGDIYGLKVGAIYGEDQSICNGAGCESSLIDVVLTGDPSENLRLWINYDWRHTSGEDTLRNPFTGQSVHGDAHGVSVAGRLALADDMGIASRVEYIRAEDTLTAADDDIELFTLTGTFDKTLAEGLVTRLELRWDTYLQGDGIIYAFNQRTDGGATNNDQLVALWQIYYEF
jgi:hypothetical protein